MNVHNVSDFSGRQADAASILANLVIIILAVFLHDYDPKIEGEGLRID